MASVSARSKQRLPSPVLQEGGRSALFRDWVLPRGIEGGISATIPAMPIEEIVKQLQAERDRLNAAINALTTITGSNTTRPSGRRKRTLSASARRKISLAQKARWAKRASSGQAGTARPKPTMSASARRKIAAAQRARWAKLKKQK